MYQNLVPNMTDLFPCDRPDCLDEGNIRWKVLALDRKVGGSFRCIGGDKIAAFNPLADL